MHSSTKAAVQKRLGRIEGQVRGVAAMVADNRYCIDIITQISAARAALRRLEEDVLQEHIAHCVEKAITSGNAASRFKRSIRCANTCALTLITSPTSNADTGNDCKRAISPCA